MNEYDIVITKTNSYDSSGRIYADSYVDIDRYIACLGSTDFAVIQVGYDANSMTTEYIRKDLIETIKVTHFQENVVLMTNHPMMQVGLIPWKEHMRLAESMMRGASKMEVKE